MPAITRQIKLEHPYAHFAILIEQRYKVRVSLLGDGSCRVNYPRNDVPLKHLILELESFYMAGQENADHNRRLLNEH